MFILKKYIHLLKVPTCKRMCCSFVDSKGQCEGLVFKGLYCYNIYIMAVVFATAFSYYGMVLASTEILQQKKTGTTMTVLNHVPHPYLSSLSPVVYNATGSSLYFILSFTTCCACPRLYPRSWNSARTVLLQVVRAESSRFYGSFP